MEHIIKYNKSKYFVIVIVLSILFGSVLDAKRYKRVRYRRANALDALNKFIKGDSDKTVYRYKKKRKYRRRPRRRAKRKSKKSSTVKKISTATVVAATTATVATTPKATIVTNIYASDEKKIQNSLKNLKLYRGDIDGNVNNFETRSAITSMNQKFGNVDTPFLDKEVKDTLIYLSDLYSFNKNLSLQDDSEESKIVKVQTALKILGFYHADVDGITGPGTRSSISKYRESQGLTSGKELDFEDEYQLVSKAKDMNSKNIEKAKEGLGLKPKISTRKPKKDIDRVQPIENKLKKSKSDIGLSDSFE